MAHAVSLGHAQLLADAALLTQSADPAVRPAAVTAANLARLARSRARAAGGGGGGRGGGGGGGLRRAPSAARSRAAVEQREARLVAEAVDLPRQIGKPGWLDRYASAVTTGKVSQGVERDPNSPFARLDDKRFPNVNVGKTWRAQRPDAQRHGVEPMHRRFTPEPDGGLSTTRRSALSLGDYRREAMPGVHVRSVRDLVDPPRRPRPVSRTSTYGFAARGRASRASQRPVSGRKSRASDGAPGTLELSMLAGERAAGGPRRRMARPPARAPAAKADAADAARAESKVAVVYLTRPQLARVQRWMADVQACVEGASIVEQLSAEAGGEFAPAAESEASDVSGALSQ